MKKDNDAGKKDVGQSDIKIPDPINVETALADSRAEREALAGKAGDIIAGVDNQLACSDQTIKDVDKTLSGVKDAIDAADRVIAENRTFEAKSKKAGPKITGCCPMGKLAEAAGRDISSY